MTFISFATAQGSIPFAAARDAAAMVLDKQLLRLMQAACQAERLETALDAAGQLTHQDSFDTALIIANHSSMPSLAEKVDILKVGRDCGEHESWLYLDTATVADPIR